MTRKALSLPFLLENILPVARMAGEIIMTYYQRDNQVYHKSDKSPVTDADRQADAYIVRELLTLAPGIACVSEEGNKPDVASAGYFWLVDPLDGTRSFVRGSGFFTVNIGLIGPDRQPVAGVIYDPVHQAMYWGYEDKAFRKQAMATAEEIQVRYMPASERVALVSSHNLNRPTEQYLTTQGIHHRVPCASSIKFCRVAEGEADIYPRFGPTMEWDTAAGHAILQAAGGKMTNPDATPFLYGKPGFENGSFLAGS